MEVFKYLFTFYTIKVVLCGDYNYIVNGGFEFPALGAGVWSFQNTMNWTGHFYQVNNPASPLYQGQIVELQVAFNQNRFIEQTVTLPEQSICNLSFTRQCLLLNPHTCVLEVYFNGLLNATYDANDTAIYFQSLIVDGMAGYNTVKFNEIGDQISDGTGTWVDSVSLTCDPVSSLDGNFQPWYIMFSAHAGTISGLRYIHLLAEDIWFYNYDKYSYEGTIQAVFNTIQIVEYWKFMVFDRKLKWKNSSNSMELSNYQPFTIQKFLAIESQSTVLIQIGYPFFIYTVPETILISLFLYLIFRLLSKYPISSHVRKFYFIKTVIALVLIEGNMVYFTYISFGHFCLSFSFTWRDKLALAFTTVFFGLVVIFTFSFYFLLGQFLKKRAGYFMTYYYRCHSGAFLITMKNLVRNFLRGITYYFLHELYLKELVLLSIVEVIEAVVTILVQSKKKVFVSKIFYSLELIINFLFILLNFSLYFGVAYDTIYFDRAMKSIALELQKNTIYLMISAAVIGVIADLLPMPWLRKKQGIEPRKQYSNKNSQKLDKQLGHQQNQKQKRNQSARLSNLIKQQKIISEQTAPKQPDEQQKPWLIKQKRSFLTVVKYGKEPQQVSLSNFHPKSLNRNTCIQNIR